jgi:hypothetical protein
VRDYAPGRGRSGRLSRFFKNFRRKPLNASALFPGIRGKPCLDTGLFQELLAIPVPGNRDLRQKQPTASALGYDHAMLADDDFVRSYLRRLTEDGNFHVQRGYFIGGYRREPGIGKRCSHGTFLNCLVEGR